MVVQTCNPSPQKVKAGRLGVQRHPQGHNEFEGSLLRPCLKKQNKQNKLPEPVAKTPKNFQWKKIRGEKNQNSRIPNSKSPLWVYGCDSRIHNSFTCVSQLCCLPRGQQTAGPLGVVIPGLSLMDGKCFPPSVHLARLRIDGKRGSEVPEQS